LRKSTRISAKKRAQARKAVASVPQALRDVLLSLGFVFDDPMTGRLETGDVEAVELLIGRARAVEVRAEHGRLFGPSGRAAMTVSLDDLTMAVVLGDGTSRFEPEDVFRWLRWFRDANFFGESQEPTHPDRVRDLRRAPREAPLVPLVVRGVMRVPCLPAQRHQFRAAAGLSADDFYVMGRTASTRDRSPSLLLHVVCGRVRAAHSLEEALTHLHVTDEGTVWGLSHSGAAMRFAEGVAWPYPLVRPGRRGASRWYGMAGSGSRVFVFGAGALLELQGDRFVPFQPQPELEHHETVVAVHAQGDQLWMLVCGNGVGAVAHFDGTRWLPIADEQEVEGQLVDLDVWRGVSMVLARSGEVWQVESGAPRAAPTPVRWDRRQPAFASEDGAPRGAHAIRGYDGGVLLASDGGVLAVGAGEPLFHAATSWSDDAR
jgi:hypothetical protein